MNIYVDGGTRGSRICLVDGNTTIVKYRKKKPTNNELEYLALLYALGYVRDRYRKKEVIIYSDSKLVVNQINKKWRVTTESLMLLHEKCSKMLTNKIKIRWVRRNFNRAGWVLES